jgi:hypothetical protein
MLKMQIQKGGLDLGMTQKMLQRKKVDALLQGMRGKTMTKRMNRRRL